jgi:hypothetical protein
MIKKFEHSESTYIHREVLYYSREHRPQEIVTFTDKVGMTKEREDKIPGLFPEHSDTEPKNMRPYRFNKPVIFLSARVHPGETPASFVLEGIWKMLANDKSE